MTNATKRGAASTGQASLEGLVNVMDLTGQVLFKVFGAYQRCWSHSTLRGKYRQFILYLTCLPPKEPMIYITSRSIQLKIICSDVNSLTIIIFIYLYILPRGANPGGIHPAKISTHPPINICFHPPNKKYVRIPQKSVNLYSRDSALYSRHMLPPFQLLY